MLIATVIAFLVAHFLSLPSWIPLHISFFHPLAVFITDRGLYVASTKVIGYTGMVFATIALVVTSHDTELIGALRQLRVPAVVIFFLSTVFRSLDLALSDYTIIRQAQLARAINARPRSIFRRLSDLGSLAVPIVATMIRRSSEIGDALQMRGYTLGSSSADFYETRSWRWLDWSIVALSLVLLLLAFVPHDTLTHLLGWCE
jgi:energy-coupling factor transporter transmembrane protein EcfT